MSLSYKTGDVYKICFDFGYETYVVIIPHKHSLGFKSLIASKYDPSIHIDVLKKYKHEFVFNGADIDQYKSLWSLMDRARPTHARLWEYFDAEGWNAQEDFENDNNAKAN